MRRPVAWGLFVIVGTALAWGTRELLRSLRDGDFAELLGGR